MLRANIVLPLQLRAERDVLAHVCQRRRAEHRRAQIRVGHVARYAVDCQTRDAPLISPSAQVQVRAQAVKTITAAILETTNKDRDRRASRESRLGCRGIHISV